MALISQATFSGLSVGGDIIPNPLVKYNFKFTEERRLSAKILTMLVRDFRHFTQAECEMLFMASI